MSLNELEMQIIIRGDIVSKDGTPMVEGMASAQASHAAVICSAKCILDAHFVAIDFAEEYFTKLTKRARDDRELQHIMDIAVAKGFIVGEMYDTNEDFYGHTGEVRTAIAISPAKHEEFVGVSDYVPLW